VAPLLTSGSSSSVRRHHHRPWSLARRRPDLSPIGDVLGDSSLRGIAWFTLWQAALSTGHALVALRGYVVARLRFRGRALVRALVLIVRPSHRRGQLGVHSLGIEPSLRRPPRPLFQLRDRRAGRGRLVAPRPRQEEAAHCSASLVRAFVGVTLPALPALLAQPRSSSSSTSRRSA
jgi:hypothetical protein